MTEIPRAKIQHHQHGELPSIWVTRINADRIWVTQSQYYIHFHYGEEAEMQGDITIPAGYRFDLASVPRWAWRLVAPFELSLVAPLVHDVLYEQLGRADMDSDAPALTRKQVDQVFLHLMEREGIPAFRRRLAYRAVRMGGGMPWKKNQRYYRKHGKPSRK